MTVKPPEAPVVPDDGQERVLAPAPPTRGGVDRFDRAIVVTRTRAWVGLAAALALVVGVLVWSTTTQIDQTVTARAVALRNGTLAQAVAPVSGTVVRLDVTHEGDRVADGQDIAVMKEPGGATATVASPISGTVVQIVGEVGVTVDAGTPLYRIAQGSGQVVVRTFLSPDQASLLSVGDSATVQVVGGTTVPGRVSYIAVVPVDTKTLATLIGDPALAPDIATGGQGVSVLVRPLRPWTPHFDGVDFAKVTFVYGQQYPIDYVF